MSGLAQLGKELEDAHAEGGHNDGVDRKAFQIAAPLLHALLLVELFLQKTSKTYRGGPHMLLLLNPVRHSPYLASLKTNAFRPGGRVSTNRREGGRRRTVDEREGLGHPSSGSWGRHNGETDGGTEGTSERCVALLGRDTRLRGWDKRAAGEQSLTKERGSLGKTEHCVHDRLETGKEEDGERDGGVGEGEQSRAEAGAEAEAEAAEGST